MPEPDRVPLVLREPVTVLHSVKVGEVVPLLDCEKEVVADKQCVGVGVKAATVADSVPLMVGV